VSFPVFSLLLIRYLQLAAPDIPFFLQMAKKLETSFLEKKKQNAYYFLGSRQ
jgi:hypothetical protein